MIRLQGIRKVFNAGRPNEFVALDDITINLESRGITVLTGPSGSGKTTFLSIIGAMARPTSGRIHLHDREMTSLPERFLTKIRRDTFGIIFQQFNLVKGLTVLENVMLPAYPKAEKYELLSSRAMSLLSRLNINDKAHSKIEWLSGGESQRAAIARALINDPEIIIADEPTAHLDTKLSHEFMDIMMRLKDREKTILIASHDPIVYRADGVCRVVEMRDGKIVTNGKQ